MTWVRLDDLLPHHRKLMACGKAAPTVLGYYTASIAFANRQFTDGVILEADLPLLIPASPRPTAAILEALVSVGLWDARPEGGWRIHDFLEWNRSAAARKAKWAADSERKRRGIHAEAPADSNGSPRGIQTESSAIEPKKSLSRVEQSTTPPLPPSGGFERFWTEYPKKIGKGAARTAWSKAKAEPLTQAILEAVIRQFAYLGREGGKFTPLPATWLNQRRWEDDPPADFAHTKTKANTAGIAEWLHQQQEGRDAPTGR